MLPYMALEASEPSPVASVVDSQLRCPSCEYNLTGIADQPSDSGIEYRCPECGASFDPQELERIRASGLGPIPIWEDKVRSLAVRFSFMCLATWFTPWRVGRTFPLRHRPDAAWPFRAIVIAVAIYLYLISSAFSLDGDGYLVSLAAAIGALIGVIVCELLIWAAFSQTLGKDNTRRGLVGMFRSFVILSTIVLGVGAARGFYMYRSPMPAIALLLLWWWLALGSAIAAVPGSVRHKVIVIATIPVAAAIAIFGGFFCGIFIGATLLPIFP